MRLLVVEDDRQIGEALVEALKKASNAVDWVKNGTSGLEALSCQEYDAVLLDLGLPDIRGLEVLKQIRGFNNDVPILITTALDDIEDRLKGLDGGADDYIVKPFIVSELLARIRAVMRRKNGLGPSNLKAGQLELDKKNYKVTFEGNSYFLTKRESSLLEALLLRPGVILSKNQLEEKIYGWGEEIESNAVEFIIHSIRKKIGKNTIRNIRGLGWTLNQNL